MSYYSEIDFGSNIEDNNFNLTKKERFITKQNPQHYQPSKNILIKYDESNIPDSRHIKPESQFYCSNYTQTAGRGFGNLNVSNDIRYGGASRLDNKDFRIKREAEQLFEYQFQYLDKNPNNSYTAFTRGGDPTRKQNQLQVDTMRQGNGLPKYTNFNESLTKKKEININY